MTPQDIVTITSIATNLSIVTVGVKLVRHLSRLELKVDTMWGVFMRNFGSRHSDMITSIEDTDE